MDREALLAQALVDEVVAFQGSTLGELIGSAQAQSAGLTAALQPLLDAASGAWTDAARTAAEHISLVMQANPGRPMEQILAMPDVQAVLRTPFTRATERTRESINAAWETGMDSGLRAANDDLRIAGHDLIANVHIEEDLRQKLLADAHDNGAAARDRFLAAIVSEDPAAVRASLLNVGSAQARRAAAGVDTSGKHAASATKEEALKQASKRDGTKLYKVWITSFSATTCATCAALHGTRRKLDQPFPANAHFGDTRPPRVFGGVLNHPPRHPNCRCRIVIHQSEMEDEDGPTISSLLEVAREWWARKRGAVGLAGIGWVRPYLRLNEFGKVEHVAGYKRDVVSAPSVPESKPVELPKMTLGTLPPEAQATVRNTLAALSEKYPSAAAQITRVAAAKLTSRLGSFANDGTLKVTNIPDYDPDLAGTVAHEFGHAVLQDLAGGDPIGKERRSLLAIRRKRANRTRDPELIRQVNEETRAANAELEDLDRRIAGLAKGELRDRIRAAFDNDAGRFHDAIWAEFTHNPTYVFMNPEELIAQAFAHHELGRRGPISDIVGEWVREQYAERDKK